MLLALESHRPDAGQMTPDSELLEHTIRVCAQCLWEFCSNGWQVRLCVGERNAKGNPIATPYGAGNTMYHRLLQQLAELQLQDVLSMPRLLSLSASLHDTGNRAADHALYRPACGTLEATVRRVGAGDGTCP